VRSFDVRRLDAMGYDDLRGWMLDLLEGHHGLPVPPDANEPAEILGVVFSAVRGDTRVVMQQVLVDFLQDLAENDPGVWRGTSGLEVIRALPHLVFEAQLERARNLLLAMAENREAIPDRPANYHLAALQGLLDLCYREQAPSFRLDADFWRRQRAEGPYRLQYLTTIVEGLARWKPEEALAWLADQEWDGEVATALAYLCPTLVRIPGFDAAFDAMRPRLQPQAVSAVQGFRDVLAGRALMEPILRYSQAVQAELAASRREEDLGTGVFRLLWDDDLVEKVGAGLRELAEAA
jgi:hypothetical protein